MTGEIEDYTRVQSTMTVRQVYAVAAAFIGDREGDDRDERDFAPIYMTVLLQEALDAENTLRKSNGEAPLTAAPTPGIDDAIPYSEKIVRGALPYGLAWQYHQDAGNNQLAAMYRNMFVDGLDVVKKTNRGFAVSYLSILLQEALDAENSIRAFNGEPELASAPILGIDDDVPYHDDITRGALPYGIAWQFHQNAGNLQLADTYRMMFNDAVNRAYKFVMRAH